MAGAIATGRIIFLGGGGLVFRGWNEKGVPGRSFRWWWSEGPYQ